MGKNKLARWAELESFPNVIQPDIKFGDEHDHALKGKWNKEIFRNNNPIVLELGCGRGEYTTGLAARFPEKNFIGVDIKGARMWRGAKTANEMKYSNTAFIRTRIEFIDRFFGSNEVDEIWLTFPDPHADKRNSNKRLSCPWFLNKYRKFLKHNGLIHLKTDNIELHRYTLKTAQRNNLEVLCSTNDLHTDLAGDGILEIRTHYEAIFLAEGKRINYLSFRLPADKEILDAYNS